MDLSRASQNIFGTRPIKKKQEENKIIIIYIIIKVDDIFLF